MWASLFKDWHSTQNENVLDIFALGPHEYVPELLVADSRLASSDLVLVGEMNEACDIRIPGLRAFRKNRILGSVFVPDVCDGLIWQCPQIRERSMHLISSTLEEIAASPWCRCQSGVRTVNHS